MKNLQLVIIIILTTLFLFSCGENPPSQKNEMASNSLSNSIDSILSMNSISYISNYEQILTADDATITTITTSEIKRTNDPFVIWNKVQNTESSTNEQRKEASIESYQERSKNGLEMFYRVGDMQWTKSSINDKNQVNKYIENSKAFIEACYYLLNTNLYSFKMMENKDGLLKFSGSISQSSVVEAYEKYFREFYIDGGLIEGDKELSNMDALLKEINSGKIYELMVGIPSLAFSDKSTPIIIWINAKNNVISRVEINKIDVTQAILNKSFGGTNNNVPKVEKSILTFDVLEINTFDAIPMPQ